MIKISSFFFTKLTKNKKQNLKDPQTPLLSLTRAIVRKEKSGHLARGFLTPVRRLQPLYRVRKPYYWSARRQMTSLPPLSRVRVMRVIRVIRAFCPIDMTVRLIECARHHGGV